MAYSAILYVRSPTSFFGGLDRQAHLLGEVSAVNPRRYVPVPSGRRHDLGESGATLSPEKRQDDRFLAAFARCGGFVRYLFEIARRTILRAALADSNFATSFAVFGAFHVVPSFEGLWAADLGRVLNHALKTILGQEPRAVGIGGWLCVDDINCGIRQRTA